MKSGKRFALALLCAASSFTAAAAAQVRTAALLTDEQIKDIALRLKLQEDQSREAREELKRLREALDKIRQNDTYLDQVRAGQSSPIAPALPQAPVGEKPKQALTIEQVTAMPEGINVLALPGSIIATPSVEYTRLSTNRLVFRGIEIVPGIQLGLVDANAVAADTTAAVGDVRVGLFDRVEAEIRVPYFYRHQALTTVSQQVTAGTAPATQTTNLEGMNLGDIEFSGRYQINAPSEDNSPIYIASLRVKSTTGTGPFDVNFDSSGIATELPTGTGFWAAGPGITAILPSDPAVLFASLGYLHSFSADVNKMIGTTLVGRVEPGDSLDGALGFGLALNSRFSFSLGYAHSMIFPSRTQLGTTTQTSNTLQAGSLTMGWSYQFNEHYTINNNFQFGITSDAPDLVITVRVPFGI